MKEQKEAGFTKISILENEIEAQVVGSILDEQNIPHLIKSYHDTAFNGLFQMQKGWGAIYALKLHEQDILEIIDSVRSSADEEKNVQVKTNSYSAGFEQVLKVAGPPTIKALFLNSKALIVSGKYIDRAMIKKGKAISIAANGRSYFVIRGALQAAQKANSVIIIEIAKSEGGAGAYCAVNYWNMARIVDSLCNELGITVPVAIHADHYGIKNEKDIENAKFELFDCLIPLNEINIQFISN